jgi:plastocyanin
MFRSSLIASNTLVILSILGSINLIAFTAIASPISLGTSAFATTTTTTTNSTSSSSSSATSAAVQDISDLLRGIEQFTAPSGYEQARQDPSFGIHIPFSDLGTAPFEPSHISIPVGMGVIWFNDDDSVHAVTFNDTSPESIQSGDIAPGGFFVHRFMTPGTYDYYDSYYPSAKGRIKVGSEFEPGQNMNMLIGGDTLPFQAGKVGRTTFSFVPYDNVQSIPPTLSITYSVSITDANGNQLYSNQFDDSDGILDLELIPSTGQSSYQTSGAASSSNQTSGAASGNFVTWGPDLTDQEGVASDGTYHVMGPVLTENQDYTITVSITSVNNAPQSQPPSDDFLLPAANSTGGTP